MSISTSWYDPVGYHFLFFAISEKNVEPSIKKACEEFMDELKPFYSLWISKGGRILGERKLLMRNGNYANVISNTEELEAYRNTVSTSELLTLEVSPVPGRTRAKFAVPGRSIPKATKDQVMHFTDLLKLKEIDKTAQKEWLLNLLNCPTDDLRGLFFPKRCFVPDEMYLQLTYDTCCSIGTRAYRNEVLKDADIAHSDSDESKPYYLHMVYVSVPRFMLDAMGQPFTLQSAWKKRLSALCEMFEYSTGCMKMDVFELGHVSLPLTGNGRFFPGFSNYLPDIAWGMCLTDKQVQALGGIEQLKDSQVFHDVEILGNNKFFLQHTPDISIVTKEEAAKLWKIASPHMNVNRKFSHCVGEPPVSFRMGIDYDQVQMDDYGDYSIRMNQETNH